MAPGLRGGRPVPGTPPSRTTPPSRATLGKSTLRKSLDAAPHSSHPQSTPESRQESCCRNRTRESKRSHGPLPPESSISCGIRTSSQVTSSQVTSSQVQCSRPRLTRRQATPHAFPSHSSHRFLPLLLLLVLLPLPPPALGNPFKENYGPPEGAPNVTLVPFVDPLTFPVLVPLSRVKGALRVSAYYKTQKFHRDLPPTPIFAFGTSQAAAATPGPTLVAVKGVPSAIEWGNNISLWHHILPVDPSLGCSTLPQHGVPITVHVHGAHCESASDGHPDTWITGDGQKGPKYSQSVFSYPNLQPGSTMWYHDHTACITRLNVAAGLTGAYLLWDPATEARLGLPLGLYDRVLLLQDKTFMANGSVWFPAKGGNSAVHPSWMPEYVGAHYVVNGKVSPFFRVLQRRYRFRLINGANARFLTLSLQTGAGPTARHLPFYVVAGDGGFLPRPVGLRNLTIAPGERAEIVVDFSRLPPGTWLTLLNTAPAPYPFGLLDSGKMLLFIVTAVPGAAVRPSSPWQAAAARDVSRVPPVLKSDMPALTVPTDARLRLIPMSEIINVGSGYPLKGMLEFRLWESPVTVSPRFGDSEVWYIINLTVDWHAFHVHFAPHRVLWRRAIDPMKYRMQQCNVTEGTCYKGPAIPPFPFETGWKDTTQVPHDMVTAILIHFDPWEGQALPFDPTTGPGYVFHCHMLDHEDNAMMRPLIILPKDSVK